MTESTDLLKGNVPIVALLTLVLGGGGYNILSERSEETERNEVVTGFREADYIQDTKYDALLQRVNDMNTQLQLLQQRVE